MLIQVKCVDFQCDWSITMGLRFEIVLTVEVDEDSNFLEVSEDSTLEVIKEKISDCVYDLDDLEIVEVDVTRRID